MSKKVGYPKGMNRKAKGTTGDTTVRVSYDIRDWLNEMKMEGETVNDVLKRLRDENQGD